VQQLRPSPSKIHRKISRVASLVMLKSLSHSKRTAEILPEPALILPRVVLSSRNQSMLETRAISQSLATSIRQLSNSRLRPLWVDLLLSFQHLQREPLALKINLRAFRRIKRRRSRSQRPRDLLSLSARSRVFSIDKTKTMLRPTRISQKSRRSLPNRLRFTRLSLLAGRERLEVKASNMSIPVITRVAKTARERVVNINLIRNNKSRMRMTTVTALNMSKRRGNAELTAEAVVVELAVAVVVSIVRMITSTVEVVTDPRLIMVMRDPKRLSKHPRLLLHQRKKKSRLLFLLRNSLAGVMLLSSE
jgi:hypothetical protein